MPRSDLFELATANETALGQRFETLCNGVPARTPLLRRFSDTVGRRASISVNMTSPKLMFFLRDGVYLNPHEVAARLASSTETAEAVLRRLQGEWYERRVAFDRHFREGEQFRYGALNLGGDGVTYYGKFCVVFDSAVTISWQCAYLPGNSLELYVAAGGASVNETAIAGDAATHATRHCLATLKHAAQVGEEEERWAVMLCSGDVFVEAIFTNRATPTEVAQVRMQRSELRRLGKLIVKEKVTGLAEDEAAEVRAFVDLQEELGAVRLKVVGV